MWFCFPLQHVVELLQSIPHLFRGDEDLVLEGLGVRSHYDWLPGCACELYGRRQVGQGLAGAGGRLDQQAPVEE